MITGQKLSSRLVLSHWRNFLQRTHSWLLFDVEFFYNFPTQRGNDEDRFGLEGKSGVSDKRDEPSEIIYSRELPSFLCFFNVWIWNIWAIQRGKVLKVSLSMALTMQPSPWVYDCKILAECAIKLLLRSTSVIGSGWRCRSFISKPAEGIE